MSDDENDIMAIGERLMMLAGAALALVETLEDEAPKGPDHEPLRAYLFIGRGGIMTSANVGYGDTSERPSAAALCEDMAECMHRIALPFDDIQVNMSGGSPDA